MKIISTILLIVLIFIIIYSVSDFRTLENFQLIEIKNNQLTDKGICCFGNENEITNLNQCKNKITAGSTCNKSQEDCYKCTGNTSGWFPFIDNNINPQTNGCGCSLCINSFGCGSNIIPSEPTPTDPFPPTPTPTDPFPPTPTPTDPFPPTPTPTDPFPPTPTPTDPFPPTPTPTDPLPPTPTPTDPLPPTPTPTDPFPPTPTPTDPLPPIPTPPTPTPPIPTPPTPPAPMPVDGWFGNNSNQKVKSTHYWDCSGQSCDACQSAIIWNNQYGYKTPFNYAPVDPKTLGGSKYGEVLWMTAAVDKPVSLNLRNANVKGLEVSGNCTGDPEKGDNEICRKGCGKCALVKKLDDTSDDNTILVMQRNIIGNNCPEPGGYWPGWPGGQFDLNTPGMDCNPNIDGCPSTAHTCGNKYTNLNKQSGYSVAEAKGTQNRLAACQNLKDPSGQPANPKLIEGCKLFVQYADKVGGIGGEHLLKYKPVDCPENYINYIKSGIEAHNWGQ